MIPRDAARRQRARTAAWRSDDRFAEAMTSLEAGDLGREEADALEDLAVTPANLLLAEADARAADLAN
jgi:hypothetical protein